MNVSNALEDLSKFFNEILGYLLPGFMFNLMIYIVVDLDFLPLMKNEYLLNPWVAIFLSYIMGYFVYGLTNCRDSILREMYSTKLLKMLKKVYTKIRKKLKKSVEYFDPKTILDSTIILGSKSEEFKLAKTFLQEQIENDVENWDFNGIRSLVMSYIPEADQKIYTFMFRSELGNHIGFVFFSFGVWMLFAEITSSIFNNTLLIKQNLLGHYYIPILMILISYFFHITRKRFLLIAYKIPFSIFISKYKSIK